MILQNRFRKDNQQSKANPRNEGIRCPYITLITDDGEKIDNCETKKALQMAYDKGLDLVLVAPGINPPVAKIMDWGKYKYELTKKLQQNKKQQKQAELKEIRLRPQTDIHDREIKLKKAEEFLNKGHKVKIVMMFRGREAMYIDRGKETINKIIDDLKSISQIEDHISYQFKRLSVTLTPVKK